MNSTNSKVHLQAGAAADKEATTALNAAREMKRCVLPNGLMLALDWIANLFRDAPILQIVLCLTTLKFPTIRSHFPAISEVLAAKVQLKLETIENGSGAEKGDHLIDEWVGMERNQ